MVKLARRIINVNAILFYCIATICYVIWAKEFSAYLDKNGIEYSQNVVQDHELIHSSITFSDVAGKVVDKVDCALSFPKTAIVDRIAIPVIEELVLRWLPSILLFSVFGIIIRVQKKRNISSVRTNVFKRYSIIIVILVTSVIFGLTHGNIYNVLLQGVGGLIYYVCYLRVYYRRKWAGKFVAFQIYPLLASTIYHIFINQVWRIVGLRV